MSDIGVWCGRIPYIIEIRPLEWKYCLAAVFFFLIFTLQPSDGLRAVFECCPDAYCRGQMLLTSAVWKCRSACVLGGRASSVGVMEGVVEEKEDCPPTVRRGEQSYL